MKVIWGTHDVKRSQITPSYGRSFISNQVRY